MWEAFGRRLRRNYLWIFLVLYISWVAKIWLFPEQTLNLSEFVARSGVGPVSGQFMFVLGVAYHSFLAIIAIATVSMTRATGEVLPRFGVENEYEHIIEKNKGRGIRGWLYPRHQRRQLMALIVTDKAKAVSDRILSDLKRGVTALSGKGMYTGQEHAVLMCALTVTEVHNLKSAVAKEDPRAFVIVSPAHEVLGLGFNPLEEK